VSLIAGRPGAGKGDTSGQQRCLLDVLVVASHRDFNTTAQCLRNLVAYFPARRRVVLATDRRQLGEELVKSVGMADVSVVADESLLSARESRLPGWYRQQIIKLRAGEVLSGDTFCVVSGDTLLARTLPVTSLVSLAGSPYLYVNRYRYPSVHLSYERRRVRAVAELLGVTPNTSLILGDFISDFFCFERSTLLATIERLRRIHGAEWTGVLEGRDTSPADQERFGEYSLYAVVALELAGRRPPVRICRESHVLQLHSRRSLERARFEAPIVHLVDKGIKLDEVAERAALFGVELLPRSEDGREALVPAADETSPSTFAPGATPRARS
jgi:hypothetical protein